MNPPNASPSWRDPRLALVALQGFASGLPLALTGATLTFRLAQVGVDKTTVGLFTLVGIAYSLKFLWSWVVDQVRLPVVGRLGRRRSWVLVLQLGLVAAILGLGGTNPADDPWRTALVAVVVAFLSATQDIVIDAWRIELLRPEQQGLGAAATQWGYRFGMIASGAGALYAADAWGWTAAYSLMAGLMGIGVLTTLASPDTAGWPADVDRRFTNILAALFSAFLVVYFVTRVTSPDLGGLGIERSRQVVRGIALAVALGIAVVAARRPRQTDGPSLGAAAHAAIVAPFADFMRRERWLAVLIAVVLYKFGDALAGTMTSPLYVELQFTASEIATVTKVFGVIASMAGIAVGGALTVRFGAARALLVCGVAQMLSNLGYAALADLGHSISALYVVIGLENLTGGMGSAAFVTWLSALCARRYTATQYALLSSLASVGRTTLAASGGWMAEWLGWVPFFVVSTSAALPGLVLVWWLAGTITAAEDARKAELA